MYDWSYLSATPTINGGGLQSLFGPIAGRDITTVWGVVLEEVVCDALCIIRPFSESRPIASGGRIESRYAGGTWQ